MPIRLEQGIDFPRCWSSPLPGAWGHSNLSPRKSGVLRVLGVQESLKASNGKAYSDGTPTHARRNTWCSEHQSCSVNQPNTAPAIPCRPLCLGGRTRNTSTGLRWYRAAILGCGEDELNGALIVGGLSVVLGGTPISEVWARLAPFRVSSGTLRRSMRY